MSSLGWEHEKVVDYRLKMRKVRKIIALSVFAVFMLFLTLFLVGYISPKKAGLVVNANLPSNVYIDGQLMGSTPFETIVDAGEVVVKIVPESTELLRTNYEAKVQLGAGIKTIIRRDFGPTEEESQGEIISFERVGGGETSLAIVTIPDGAQISIDGEVRGSTPFKTASIAGGEYNVLISSPGFKDRSFKVRIHERHKLTVVVQLAKLHLTDDF